MQMHYCESITTLLGEVFTNAIWTPTYADVLNPNPLLNNCWEDYVFAVSLEEMWPNYDKYFG